MKVRLAAVAVLLAAATSCAGARPAAISPLAPADLSSGSLSTATAGVGWELFGQLCSAEPKANVAFSPASLVEALEMLAAGARGSTQAALLRLLGLPDWTPATVSALRAYQAALGRVRQLAVSNRLFEQDGLHPDPRAQADLRTAFHIAPQQVNFADEPATTNLINALVSHDTRGLIPTLFDQPLGGVQTVLTNAMYLHALWRYPFDRSAPGSFAAPTGPTTAAYMTEHAFVFALRAAGGWQQVTLPYSGNALTAVALLAPVGAVDCAVPNTAQWTALAAAPARRADLLLPKFHLTASYPDLAQRLARLGLPLGGNYSGFGAGDSQIAQVVQKDDIKVDERGTTAAAATGVAVASALEFGPRVNFDRPFLFLLEDTATHTPLFLARVANPNLP